MEDEQLDRLVGSLRAQEFILQGLAAMLVVNLPDPPAAARELKALVGDKFADALPSISWMSPERQTRLNHFSAHFAEQFWERVAQGLERQ